MSTPEPSVQLYELRIVATGEVRDADGNLLNQNVTAEGTRIVTEEEALAIIERQTQA